MPEEFHGQRSLADSSPWGCKESDTTEHTRSQLQWDLTTRKSLGRPGRAPSQQRGAKPAGQSPQGLPRSTWTLHLLLHSTTTTSLFQHLRFWLELPPSPQRVNPWPALPLSRSTFHCSLELGRLPRPSVKKLLISFLVLVQKKVLPLRWIFPHSSTTTRADPERNCK